MRRVLPVLALGMLLSGCGSSGGGSSQEEHDGDVRWVGAGSVAVAVPAWWTTGETRCLKPIETTVYAESGAMTDCADEPTDAELAEVSSLAVIRTDSALGEGLLREMRPAGSVDGREVLELDGCADFWDAVCRRVFAVPSAGVAFGVVIADDADGSFRAVRDSLRVLPDDTTTVPTTYGRFEETPGWGAPPGVVEHYARALDAAGLVVERVVAPLPGADDAGAGGSIADLPPGSLLDVDPQPGTPVPRGSSVTVTVMPSVPSG
ncbi:PASTA domain-containing protein [Nocardioides marmoraquaticus]